MQQSVPEPEHNKSFAKVKLRRVTPGRCHTIFQTADGILLSCGNNEVGQLGVGVEAEEYRDSPQVIEVLRGKQIVDFSVGLDHTIAVSREGKVYSWGYGPEGQLGLGDEENRPAPTEIPALQGIVGVGCGLDHSVVLDCTYYYIEFSFSNHPLNDMVPRLALGGFWSFGRNDLGQLGIGRTEELIPRPVRGEVLGVKFVKVACGGAHSVALSSSGVLYSWGGGTSGRLGHGVEENLSTPTPIQYFMDKNIKIVNFAVGGGHTLALSGTNFCSNCLFNLITTETDVWLR
jgi:alpha-tubulin suppressor-like RCC1 family protein